MASLSLRSISTRTALILGLVAALCFAGAAWVIQNKAASEQQAAAMRELEQLAAAEAAKVRDIINQSLVMVRGLAVSTEGQMALALPDRGLVYDQVKRFTEADPVALGYWLEFDRNGFDGRDDEFARSWPAEQSEAEAVAAFEATATATDLAGQDDGRVSVYWVRNEDGSLSVEPNLGADGMLDIEGEDYYLAARERGDELMFEPYLYEVEGKEVLMTSLMVPVHRNGQFSGVAGADLTLDRIQTELAKVRPFERGVVRLLSPKGMVIAAPETALLGKAWPEDIGEALRTTAAGQVLRTRMADAAVGGEVFRVYVPMTVGRAPDAFVLAVSAPVDVVMAGVVEVRNRVIMVGAVSVLVLALVVLLILTRLVGAPLSRVVTAVDAVAGGKLDYPIASGGQDEVGQVSRALRKMQSDLRARIEEERRIAAENLRVRIALDNAGTSMLIADADGSIVYANPALRKLLAQYATALSSHLPGLDLQQVEGQPLQRLQPPGAAALGQVAQVQRAELQFGSVVIAQTVAPVLSTQNERLGTVVEWRDRTQQVAVEGEVASVIEAAAQGDLSQRIGSAGKSGFFLRIAEGVDGMLEANASSIAAVQRVLAALAQGDLSQRIQADFKGVFGQMRDDVNATSERLATIVGSLREAVDLINTAAREIAAGNADLSERSEQQAANLEEAAASMEELTSTVKNNAESSRQARQLAAGATDVASRGGQVVKQVVEQMSGITAASRQIENIIGVIDGIAFQTNILALNAAVEAARAGEQGRGFAVVASEVRTLAQRSADAAKEIKGLIGESVTRVEQGANLVGSAGRTMEEIVSAVQRVNDLMAEISAASEEQAIGIDQVNQTITHMDSVTQQNVALVEEATAAAGSLEDQAGQLQQIVAVFRT